MSAVFRLVHPAPDPPPTRLVGPQRTCPHCGTEVSVSNETKVCVEDRFWGGTELRIARTSNALTTVQGPMAPRTVEVRQPGLFVRVWRFLFGTDVERTDRHLRQQCFTCKGWWTADVVKELAP